MFNTPWSVCFLITLMLGGSWSSVVAASQPPTRFPQTTHQAAQQSHVYRESFIEGFVGSETHFIFHEAETGFREVQALFLGTVSSAAAIDRCCRNVPVKKIRLTMNESYHVRLGNNQILIEFLELAWVQGDTEPFIVLNDVFVLIPSQRSQSFSLLSEWARERGFQ